MAPLEIRHRSVRPISAKHAQASRFLQQSRLESLTDIGLIHYETGTLRVTDVHHSIGEDGTDHIGVYIDVRASYDAQKTTAKASEWGIEEWIPYNI